MKIRLSFLMILCTTSLGAVMAPWYWVGFPLRLNPDYPGNPAPLIGAHFTFIFDTYHYEDGKRYVAGRIMQNNSQILNWYVALKPLRKGQAQPENVIAFMEPTAWTLSMLQLPKYSATIAVVPIGDEHDWSERWMADRQQLRQEMEHGTRRHSIFGGKKG